MRAIPCNLFAAVLVGAACAVHSAEPGGGLDASMGAVIERVSPRYGADRAGLLAGDRIVSWKSVDALSGEHRSGLVRDPFELSVLELEEPPRARVTLSLVRDGQQIERGIGEAAWRADTRPVLQGAELAGYREAARQLEAGPIASAVERLVALASAAERRGRVLDAAWLHNQVAAACYTHADFEVGERETKRAIDLARRARSLVAEAWIHRTAGVELVRKGRLAQARPHRQEVVRLFTARNPNSLATAEALRSLGILANNLSEFDTARRYGRQVDAMARKLAPQSLFMAENLHLLGNIEFFSDNTDGAMPHHARALELRSKVDPGGAAQARSLTMVGNIYWRRGELATAAEHVMRAIEIQRRYDDPVNLGQMLINLGNIAHDQRDLGAAERHRLEALAIFEKIAPEGDQTASIWMALGNIAGIRGNFAAAAHYHERALAIFRKIQPRGERVALVLYNLGNVARERGDLARAQALYEESLGITREFGTEGFLVATRVIGLGEVAEERGDLVRAEQHYTEALRIFERAAPTGVLIPDTQRLLGRVSRKRSQWPVAVTHLSRALSSIESLAPGTLYEAQVLNELAQLERARGNRDGAAQFFERALGVFERQQPLIGGSDADQVRFAARYADYYKDYVDLLVEQGNPARAFEILERYRAQVLMRALRARNSTPLPALPEALRDRHERLNRDYDAALAEVREPREGGAQRVRAGADRLRALQLERARLEEQVRGSAPRYAAMAAPSSTSARDANSLLEPGTVLLSYAVMGQHSLLFIVSHDHDVVAVKIAAGASQLSDAVSRMRLLMSGVEAGPATQSALAQASHHLYRELLAPAAPHLAKHSRLLIEADGPLHRLPWAALRVDDPNRADRQAPARFVVESYAIASTPSLAIYGASDQGRSAPRTGSQMIAFADSAAEALPAAREEVQALGRLFGPGARLFVGPEATENQAKRATRSGRYLHFATHAVIDELSPLDSYLSLAPTQGRENGLLQAWEIMTQMRIDADLVVLSACNTAIGQDKAGEGLLSLTRAFQYAGARAVLASLWAVRDESTAELMQLFYQELKSGQSVEAALRAAQLAFIRESRRPPQWMPAWLQNAIGGEDRSHPFYWAAFQVSGGLRTR